MKTVWELIKEKLSTPDELNALEKIKNKLEGDFFTGGYDVLPVGTTYKLILNKNLIRKSILLNAPVANTGKIYIGMDLFVSSSKYFAALSAGDNFSIDDYRGELYAIAENSSDKIAYGEW